MSNIKYDSLGKPLNGLVIKEEFELYYTNGIVYNEKGASIKNTKLDIIVYTNKEGLIHRDEGPAVIYNKGGLKLWYKKGYIDRDNGPAIEWPDGSKEWYKEGKRHRDNGPAIEYYDGKKEYYVNGKYCKDYETYQKMLIKYKNKIDIKEKIEKTIKRTINRGMSY